MQLVIVILLVILLILQVVQLVQSSASSPSVLPTVFPTGLPTGSPTGAPGNQLRMEMSNFSSLSEACTACCNMDSGDEGAFLDCLQNNNCNYRDCLCNGPPKKPCTDACSVCMDMPNDTDEQYVARQACLSQNNCDVCDCM